MIGPAQQQQSDAEQDRRADTLQNTHVFDPFKNDREIDEPENKEADRGTVGKVLPTGSERRQQRADSLAADPGLNAEPSARDYRSQNRSDVRAQHSARGASQN